MEEDERFRLPDDLPESEDDGGADHLPGSTIPAITLPATDGTAVDLAAFAESVVVYCYPRTGRPDRDVSPDYWDDIPGAQGCTPESRGFRNQYGNLLDLPFQEVFGLSTQSIAYQCEARNRLELPFELLSDSSLELTDVLGLPTFEVEGVTLLKRLTLVISEGRIEHVFYPIFPPDEHAEEVVDWTRTHLSE